VGQWTRREVKPEHFLSVQKNSRSVIVLYSCLEDWKRLFEQGLFTNAAVPPSVEPGRALIRMSCIATHKPEHVDRALSILEATGREFGLL